MDTDYTDKQLQRQDDLWAAVDATVDVAAGLQFDGCHKIYVIMEWDTVNKDYPHSVNLSLGDNREQGKKLLRAWWDKSCELRFIQRIDGNGRGNDQYHDLIGQGECAYEVYDGDEYY